MKRRMAADAPRYRKYKESELAPRIRKKPKIDWKDTVKNHLRHHGIGRDKTKINRDFTKVYVPIKIEG